jgi:hypothetical protein
MIDPEISSEIQSELLLNENLSGRARQIPASSFTLTIGTSSHSVCFGAESQFLGKQRCLVIRETSTVERRLCS